jgi:hypothetical protein
MGGQAWENGGSGAWGGSASDAELASHEADTTSIHGITDTSVLATATTLATAVSDHNALATAHAALMPSTLTIMPMHTPVASVGTWAIIQGTAVGGLTVPLMGNAATNAINDSISFDVGLSAGTWKITAGIYLDTVMGKATLFLDGTTTNVTIDAYAGVAAYAYTDGSGTFAVATSGIKRLAFKVDGKNASSTDYYFYLGPFTLTRTA